MSKSTFKGSLLATTIIAGVVLAAPAYAQNQPAPAPTDAQGNTPPADANAQAPAAGVQTNAAPAAPAAGFG